MINNMCLLINSESKPKIAQNNIPVYKICVKYNKLSKNTHLLVSGNKCTAIIKGIKIYGELIMIIFLFYIITMNLVNFRFLI